jgi:hypothetical protein
MGSQSTETSSCPYYFRHRYIATAKEISHRTKKVIHQTGTKEKQSEKPQREE